MLAKLKEKNIESADITKALLGNFGNLMSAFYEMQSSFLSSRYKFHSGMEKAHIILCLKKSLHLAIIRKREVNLNYDLSLNNFWFNFNNIDKPSHKIVSIVNSTGIPKETVRRKMNKLLLDDDVSCSKNKEYTWSISHKKKDPFLNLMKEDAKNLSKFIFYITKNLGINFTEKQIEENIKVNFSFFWYHFLTCELEWLKMWQNKIKDLDLILIALQSLIPTLQYADGKNITIDNFHLSLGKINNSVLTKDISVSATSVSEITGIPRATCMRKLDKLEKLGVLEREKKTKRYFINQSPMNRTKNIMTKENINSTIKIFSQYFSIILNGLINKSVISR